MISDNRVLQSSSKDAARALLVCGGVMTDPTAIVERILCFNEKMETEKEKYREAGKQRMSVDKGG